MSIYSITKYPSLVALTMIVVVLLVISAAQAASIEDPEIVTRDGQDVLLLPDEFLAAIQTEFPDYRIPIESDLTGLWASHFLPYSTWGDFNGDGSIDIAVILIKDGAWREVVMHKDNQAYVVALDREQELVEVGTEGGIDSHQQVVMRKVPKDTVETSSGNSFSHNLDSVLIGYSEIAEQILFFKDRQYDFVEFGE